MDIMWELFILTLLMTLWGDDDWVSASEYAGSTQIFEVKSGKYMVCVL